MQTDQQKDRGQLFSHSAFDWNLWTYRISCPLITPTRPHHESKMLPNDHDGDRTEMPSLSTCPRTDAHTFHCLSVASLPKVPSFLSSQPSEPRLSGHLSLVWLLPPTLAPARQLPAPTALRRPGPRAWGRARVEQVDAVLPEVEQERGGVMGQAGSLEAYILASREA